MLHTLLTPQNHAVVLIDHQPQMTFATASIDRTLLVNNVAGLAKTARLFDVPTVLTTAAADSFSGRILEEIQSVFPEKKPIDRTTMNSWDDPSFRSAVEQTGRKKIVMAGLWTEVCLVLPAIDMIQAGYEIYLITDASGGVSSEAHERAIQRLIQAGVVPMTWLQYLLELQRDWARQETYEPVLEIAKQHAGAYGVGIHYAKFALGEHSKEGKKS